MSGLVQRIYRSGKYGNLDENETVLILQEGEEPKMAGPIKYMTSIADALVLQYYEEPDKLKAAFGHELSDEDWRTVGSVLGAYLKILFSSRAISANLAHPMLEEIYRELNTESRKLSFLCGHDSTIVSFLSALGVQDYTLEGAIEPLTPIGTKVVFERWADQKGEKYYRVRLVYQSADQLRSIQPLSLEIPPMSQTLSFDDIETNEDGLIAEKDLMNLFRRKINMLYDLEKEYTEEAQDNAA